MLGYLLTGDPAIALEHIESKVPCRMNDHPDFAVNNHKTSVHDRSVPAGKRYSSKFRCQHLIMPLKPRSTG
jgi:hypothetical protein